MSEPANANSYKSPKHKLLAFFKRSRDQWRARAKEYHATNRSLQVRVRDLEASREHWRERCFEGRTAPAASAAHRGHEPPPAGPLARRSSTRTLRTQVILH
jgi:hypothetical protein